jgi:ATP-dependent DNA helicase RecG
MQPIYTWKTPVSDLYRLREPQTKALLKLGIQTLHDVLYHFPSRYADMGGIKTIQSLQDGEYASIIVKIKKIATKKTFKSKIPATEAVVEDPTGTMKVTWLHQPYIAKTLFPESIVKLSGKISIAKGVPTIFNPSHEPADTDMMGVGLFSETNEIKETIVPLYKESKGITSLWFRHALERIFLSGFLDTIVDPLPEHILQAYNLPSYKTAFLWIHRPRDSKQYQSAKKRFSFEEIFFIQLKRQQDKALYASLPTYTIDVPEKSITEFIETFPFTPTDSQMNAISQSVNDFHKNQPMLRLIEGDVGSGKTFVAATLSHAIVTNRPAGQNFGTLQVAYMAPTEVLAMQLFENFVQYFKYSGIQIGLITGSGCRKFPTKVASAQQPWTSISRPQLLKWVKSGEIAIVVGTHALIQKSVAFKHLALVIIDEQHRFGTQQRLSLAKKEGRAPHFLSMTATPIPRTLALTMYGDLDLSVIDQMPSGRKQVETTIITPNKREGVYEAIRSELQQGRQLYVICPRIDEPDETVATTLQLKSVKEEAKRLQKNIFPEYTVDIMHSKMTPADKEETMKQFSNHDIDILVSTSVVEVGVNVPNATMIIIEGAERFGLAQLHQLRGRVQRSEHQPYCYLFTSESNGKNQKTSDRLQAFLKAKNGFELAELDLELRGTGDLVGSKQWGISDIGMDAIKNIKMVEIAREEAKKIIEQDTHLHQHPLLREGLENKKEMHFE